MRVTVLGSAAGGGFPQWNCRCSICARAWASADGVRRRTQSSVAVSADGLRWVLLNCSPDIREQIGRTPALWPRKPRHSPISAVVLTNGDVDHVGGLLSLREGTPFSIHCSASTRASLARNPIFSVLAPDVVRWAEFRLGLPFLLNELEIEAFPVPGKAPLYMEGEDPQTDMVGETTVGLSIAASGRRMVYVPGCARVDDAVRARIDNADLLLFDGTVYTDEEMIREGVGHKTGRRMGHMPTTGAGGSIAALKDVEVRRRVYIHINNTNPILLSGSPERRAVEAAGWQVAEDGMEVEL